MNAYLDEDVEMIDAKDSDEEESEEGIYKCKCNLLFLFTIFTYLKLWNRFFR